MATSGSQVVVPTISIVLRTEDRLGLVKGFRHLRDRRVLLVLLLILEVQVGFTPLMLAPRLSTFAVSEPTVTKTGAHLVNAGDASFAFAIAEPTVTHTRASGVTNWKTDGATITAAKHDGTAISRGKYNGVEFFAN